MCRHSFHDYHLIKITILSWWSSYVPVIIIMIIIATEIIATVVVIVHRKWLGHASLSTGVIAWAEATSAIIAFRAKIIKVNQNFQKRKRATEPRTACDILRGREVSYQSHQSCQHHKHTHQYDYHEVWIDKGASPRKISQNPCFISQKDCILETAASDIWLHHDFHDTSKQGWVVAYISDWEPREHSSFKDLIDDLVLTKMFNPCCAFGNV